MPFHWKVKEDDAPSGLVVGDIIRESPFGDIATFWRKIGANQDLPATPPITKLDLYVGEGVGGGGGGSVTLTDSEYFYWRVKEADTPLGLVVGDLLRERVVGETSTWKKVGESSNLASAPPLAKIELAGGSSSTGDLTASRTFNSTTVFTAAQLATVQTIAATPTNAKFRMIWNYTDKPLLIRFYSGTEADPTLSSFDVRVEADNPATLTASQGHWFGVLKVVGDSPTTGFVNVITQG